MSNFDAESNNFQEKVWGEYRLLRGVKQSQMFGYKKLGAPFKGKLVGCLILPLIAVSAILSKKAFKKTQTDRNYKEFENEANVLIFKDEVKQAICDALKNLKKNEILDEEKFVALITNVLDEGNLKNQLAISSEPVLFAFVAYLIFQKGLENYCPEK